MADEARAKARRGVQAIFDRYHKLATDQPRAHGVPQLFDYDCMKNVQLVDAGPEGWVIYKFQVTREYSNLNNVLHGGAYGVLFDMFTMSALGTLAKPGYWEFMGGITRSLNITYLKGVPIGTTIYFRSRVVGIGKRLALIHGEMTSEDGSIIYATADHHKVNAPMLDEHKAAWIPWDDEMKTEEKNSKVHKHTAKL